MHAEPYNVYNTTNCTFSKTVAIILHRIVQEEEEVVFMQAKDVDKVTINSSKQCGGVRFTIQCSLTKKRIHGIWLMRLVNSSSSTALIRGLIVVVISQLIILAKISNGTETE